GLRPRPRPSSPSSGPLLSRIPARGPVDLPPRLHVAGTAGGPARAARRPLHEPRHARPARRGGARPVALLPARRADLPRADGRRPARAAAGAARRLPARRGPGVERAAPAAAVGALFHPVPLRRRAGPADGAGLRLSGPALVGRLGGLPGSSGDGQGLPGPARAAGAALPRAEPGRPHLGRRLPPPPRPDPA